MCIRDSIVADLLVDTVRQRMIQLLRQRIVRIILRNIRLGDVHIGLSLIHICKKIKAVKRSKGMSGKPVTSKPVYGYLMDEDENFIIDEEAAPVVKQIYSLCLAGNGPTKIARMLTEQQIPTPGEAPQTGNRNLLFLRRQGRVARRIKPDLSGSQPARERQNFFTFLLFLLLLYPT